MKVDVVIVTYQSAAHLTDCVRSLPAWARVIVVDNASTDGSAELAKQLECVVLRNERNEGFGRAVNRATREVVRSEYALFLNPDALVDEQSLQLLVEAMRSPGVAVAGPALCGTDGVAQRPWWEFPSARLAWREALGLHRLRPPDFSRGCDVDFVVGACFLVRTDAFRAVGGFDERYWLYGEEADLCRRLRDGGWRVRYVPAAEATHAGGASGDEQPELVAEHFARGSERFVLTHHGAVALASFRLANIVGGALRLAVLPREDPRARTRARAVARSLRTVARHPTLPAAPDRAHAAPSIVVGSLEAWDEVWRRNQFFVRELCETDPELRVLFVEPAFDPLHDLLVRRRLPSSGGAGRILPVADRPQVLRVRPVKALPRRLGRWADASLARQVQRAAARAELTDPTLWLNDLGVAGVIEHTAWPLLYDLTDDWLSSGVPARELGLRAEREARVIDVAEVVVSCSEQMAVGKRRSRPIRVISDAVDTARFRTPQPRPSDLPEAPVVVYVGTLHDDRLDVDLVSRTAADLPDVQFAFVGPDALSSRSRDQLQRVPNVTLLGPRPYEQVPAYYQHATAIAIPHLVNPFTESLDPIKAYECIAAGRPTVATPVAGFRELGAPVVVADRHEFAERLRVLVHDQAPTLPLPPGLATWEIRGKDFAAAITDARRGVASCFDPPLRVVFLGHVARRSGGELALLRLLPSLRELGVEPYVILGEDGPLVQDLRELHVPTEVLAFDPAARDLRRTQVRVGRVRARAVAGTAAYVARLTRRLRSLEPDLVHTNTLKAAYLGGVAARAAGVPVVWHIRDRIAGDYLPTGAVWLTRGLARIVPNAVVANSNATLRTLGDRRDLLARVPHVVVPDSVAPPAMRRRHRDGAFTVGMLGRLSSWKGQHIFLEAFARAFPTGPEHAVLIGAALFGEDEYEVSLHRLCDRLQITDRVTFAGHRDDAFDALGELDLLVHASTVPEPFGQVVLEGMAVGLPVIATSAGGPAEIVTHGRDGMLVPPGDIDALRETLRMLSGDPQLRRSLGEAARARALDFDPERSAKRVASLYRRVTRSSPALS